MPDNHPARRSLERRSRQRQGLLALAAFAAGLLFGWLVLGWLVLPRPHPTSRANDLDLGYRLDYLTLVYQSWTVNHDDARARERLRDLDRGELLALLNDRQADAQEGARLSAFAAALAAASPAPTARPSLRAPAATAVPTATPTPVRLVIAADVPPTARAAVEARLRGQSVVFVQPGDAAQVTLTAKSQPGAVLLSEQVFVVVDRFQTLRTGIGIDAVRALWQGQPTGDGAARLLIPEEAAPALAAILGQPAASVQARPFGSLVATLSSDAHALAIVPFDRLTPRLSALPLDGVNLLSREANVESYPLKLRIFVRGDDTAIVGLLADLRAALPATNREAARLSSIIMTGTTAIARTSAYMIEQKKDPALPARVVGPVLAAADITHVSNEISFMDGCTPVLNTMSFCSKPSYLAALKLAGVDIVGLTGNHLLDFGAAPFLKTLDIYDAAGMRYYGGGRNASEAGKTLLLTDHGNRLAFIGMNSFGPKSVWATARTPGANRYDMEGLQQAIAEARQQADVVLVELQGEETYEYAPSKNNQLQFRGALAAGADVVTGVQAHHPQAIEFGADGRGLILYGLGNLFFDQMFDPGVRQGLVARHTVYAGRLIQTELLTTMLEDYVQPRWATAAERRQILDAVFAASGLQE